MTRRQRGTVLAAAIICLIVALLMGTALVRSLVAQHRQERAELQRLQALWLAESGASRAAAALQGDAAYSGEVWKLTVEGLAGPVEAAVQIDVDQVPEQPRQRLIRVAARVPHDALSRATHRKQVVIQLPAGGDAS